MGPLTKLIAGLQWDFSMVGDDEAVTVTAVGQNVAEPNCFKMQVASAIHFITLP